MSASDVEAEARRGRLELLAIVRGLEALDQPSRVTLVTPSRYVLRGLSDGLSEWRERGWRWERFGSLVPIRDQDLWRRLDHALQIHAVECCRWEFNGAETAGGHGASEAAIAGGVKTTVRPGRSPAERPLRRAAATAYREASPGSIRPKSSRRLPSVLRQVMAAMGQSLAVAPQRAAS